MSKLIALVAPTSSGKTKLAVDLARKLKGEIVSADSRQVYRDMDLGAGKDLAFYRNIRYHLIDIVSPRTNFTLAQYQRRAYQAIKDILRRGKLPILVGGTGLYVQAVVDGYVLPEAPPDPKLRARLAKLSLPQLLVRLRKLDPATYRAIDKNNRRRLVRALEICLTTGIPLSKQRKKRPPPYEILMIGLAVPRGVLYKRISARLKERLKQGLIEEVARLHRQGLSWKRLESFGLEYRHISRYLRKTQKAVRGKTHDREFSRATIRELDKAIKDFARRQMTWFKRDKRIVWVNNQKEAELLVADFLTTTK